MKTETEERICPKCGCVYTEVPALSRVDNETLICPDCGIREALESMGISRPCLKNKTCIKNLKMIK